MPTSRSSTRAPSTKTSWTTTWRPSGATTSTRGSATSGSTGSWISRRTRRAWRSASSSTRGRGTTSGRWPCRGSSGSRRRCWSSRWPSMPGAPLTADALKHDQTLIHDTYGEVGYIDTAVEPIIDFAGEPGLVDVTLKVTEGRLVTIGDIRIEGNHFTQDKVIRRELGVYPEEPVNTKLIDRAKRRLEGTGLFSPGSVQITPLPDGRAGRRQPGGARRGDRHGQPHPGGRHLVQPGRHRQHLARAAQLRPDGLAPVRRRVLARRVVPRGPARRFNSSWSPAPTSSGTASTSANRTWPTLPTASRPASSTSSASGRSYDEIRGGLDAGVGKELWPNTQGFVNLRLESVDITRHRRRRAPRRPQGRRPVDVYQRGGGPGARHHRQPYSSRRKGTA